MCNRCETTFKLNAPLPCFDYDTVFSQASLSEIACKVLSSWYDLASDGGLACYQLNGSFYFDHNVPDVTMLASVKQYLADQLSKAKHTTKQGKADLTSAIHNLDLLIEIVQEESDS